VDFSIKIYDSLLSSLRERNYNPITFYELLSNNQLKEYSHPFIILRQDVDRLPQNSLRFAEIQAKYGIKGSYYFRANRQSWDADVIRRIQDLGHEIGYHYETMDTAQGDIDIAWDQFRYNLDELRKIVEVRTICMHGSPLSKYDNKSLWKKYDYKSLGLIGEPYYDVNYSDVFYLTDTGRRWDGWKTSVRDKIPQQETWIKDGLVFHSTNDIIKAVTDDRLPQKVMFTFHPQRWHDKTVPWVRELITQSIKNQVKKYFFVS